MTFALYELALNQDVQGRLRQEIQQVIAKHNGQITYQAMKEMKYLHMVIDGNFLFKFLNGILNLKFF